MTAGNVKMTQEQMLAAMRDKPRTGREIQVMFSVSQATASQHIKRAGSAVRIAEWRNPGTRRQSPAYGIRGPGEEDVVLPGRAKKERRGMGVLGARIVIHSTGVNPAHIAVAAHRGWWGGYGATC